MKKLILTLLYLTIITATSSYAKTIPANQKIAGLYVAFFNRAPDMSGLSYWTKRANSAQTNGQGASSVFKELSAGFAQHPVFTSTYGNLNNEDFVKAIYVNSLGREGDSEGITYWTNQLNNGLSRSDMVATFIEMSLTLDLTPQNFPNLSQSELDAAKLRQDLITNKTLVALAFVNKLKEKTDVADSQNPEDDPAYKASIKIISRVTEDAASSKAAIDFLTSIKFSDDQIGDILAIKYGESGNYVGYLIDSPIYGLNYECGVKKGLTQEDGKFFCDTFPAIFKIGNYIVGSISHMTSDSKVFPQDLLGLDRNNVEDPELIKLTQFLQALDDDRNITQKITITKETREKFNDNGGGDNSLDPDKESLKKDLPLPNPVTAMDHLRKSITPEDYRPADTSDMSKYMGKWVGGGSGWEVRFKQNYGDFVSQFTGIDKEDLPFKGEKNIMSLMVSHKTAFAFNVDKNGNIQGTGTITYDLLPNLCGLNALTKNVVNPAVNLFDKIFTLSGMVSMDTADDLVTKDINFDVKILKAAKDVFGVANSTASFIGMDWTTLITNEVKNSYLKSKQTNDMCSLVSENPKVKGGLSVGPLSLDDLLTNASVDVGNAVMQSVLTLDPKNVTSFLLNIPGLTQVQYSYKGLENGPETRTFAMSGHIDNHGKMYLHMDGLLDGGSRNLTVEYTVNYQTEKPTFPVWSPFLDEAGTVYPANRKQIIYNYKNKNEEKKYNSYDAKTGTVTTKTISVATPKIDINKETLEFPMATFKASGTKRNGVSVWHEYEYGWNAYRVSE